jgi:tRNA (Thr-GGU) A37 N-methylase
VGEALKEKVGAAAVTRSPDRPNPIGVHRATVTGIDNTTLRVDALEAVDGTPILDLKIALRESPEA